jgi:hypothetical protein
MSRRHEVPASVRPERTLTRTGLWATGPVQLQLPFEATGLSERIHASGHLKLSPDYDVFAWLCERWQARPTTSGWIRPTLYEVGSALYGKAPSGKDYRALGEATRRLARVHVTIDGYDISTGEFRDRWVSETNLMELSQPYLDRQQGIDRQGVRLSEWLRQALEEERVVRIPWRTLRAFDERHRLAKRLWLYLAAERWKRCGNGDVEGSWIACGDRLFAALGMDYERPRDARAALKRACLTVRRVDARYAAGALELTQLGRSWRIQAERPTWEAWRELRAEHEAVREAIQRSRAA